MECQFQEISPGVWKCKNCHQQTLKSKTGNIRRPCQTVADRAATFALACVKFAASGFLRRTKKNIQIIYNEKCKPCEYFVPNDEGKEEGTCSIFTCRLTPVRETVNKITWRSESCVHPVESKWRATAREWWKWCSSCAKKKES